MSTFGRWFGAMAVAMAAVGCGGGGNDTAAFPENTLQFNGHQVPADAPSSVSYAVTDRFVTVYAADGSSVMLGFQNQGDWAVYELPMGHFSHASADLIWVSVCVSTCRTYYTPDEVNGDVYVGGDEGARHLEIAGGFGLDDGTHTDEIVFSYAGPYDYSAD